MLRTRSLATKIACFFVLRRLCSGFFLVTKKIPSAPRQKPLTATNLQYSNTARKMSEWDAVNGVWLGDKATSDDELPSPLYLFGYGSLLWRPGDLLGDFPSYSCTCNGWQRLFAQRSSDHRGSPEFPGFVATLVEASYLDSTCRELTDDENLRNMARTIAGVSISNMTDSFMHSNNSKDNSSARITCSGLIWRIPDDRIKATIAELDVRERGGYHRHLINVTLKEDTAHHLAGAVVTALVYSGSTSNPNFHYLSDDTSPASAVRRNSEEINLINSLNSAENRKHTMKEEMYDDRDKNFNYRSATADVIAAAVGPSGANSEYLFKLNDFMRENGLEDPYIHTLSDDVALRMGPWRARAQLQIKHTHPTRNFTTGSSSTVDASHRASSVTDCLDSYVAADALLGWGSNEFNQLGAHTAVTHTDLQLQAVAHCVKIRQTSSQAPAQSSAIARGDNTVSSGTERSLGSSSSTDRAVSLNNPTQALSLRQVRHSQVLCGAAYSAFLGPEGTLTLWGKHVHQFVSRPVAVSVSVSVSLPMAAPAISSTQLTAANGIGIPGSGAEPSEQDVPTLPLSPTAPVNDEPVSISDVAGVALGYEHMLLLCRSGWVLALGDNQWGQCDGPRSFVRVGSRGLKSQLSKLENGNGNSSRVGESSIYSAKEGADADSEPLVRVLKLAAGVRHSAAITVCGGLHVWGAGCAATIAPRTDARSIADSGLHSTVAVSVRESSTGPVSVSLSVVQVCEINAYGAAAALEVSALKATSATASTAGAGADTVTVTESSAVASALSHSPVTDLYGWGPEDGSKLIDVSCGLHHTVCVDERGRVWSFGDNKFGSLGRTLPTAPENLPSNSHNIPSNAPNTGVSDEGESSSSSSSGSSRVIRDGFKIRRDSIPRLVEGLEPGVRWQRVSCGWSHTVVRGVRPDGTMASAAWGRRNLGQYPLEESGLEKNIKDCVGTDTSASTPQRLTLPPGLYVREVWAGSEFTVLADQRGYLWSCGWNEHGNLGRGSEQEAFQSSDGWVKVLRGRGQGLGKESGVDSMKSLEGEGEYEHVRLSTVWEGALSCGGGHVLCLTGL